MNSQKGFSALGLFLLGIVMLAIMSYAGLFNIPKSEVSDTTKYQVSGSKQIKGKGLLMTDLKLKAPDALPSTTPNPTTQPYITSAPSVCMNLDSGKPYKPTDQGQTCTCPEWLITCSNNKCIYVYTIPPASGSKLPPDAKGPYSCNYPGGPGQRYFDIKCENGTGQNGQYCVGKPVIYLYPKYPMLVNVSVKTEGKIVISDPQIEKNNSWTNVMAYPNGLLFYNGSFFRELFYESQTAKIKKPEEGFVINKDELKIGLLKFIKRLGLTRSDEQQEFLDWWIPRLQEYESPYWFVSILDKSEKQRIDKVEISPKPDTFIEFIVYFKPLDKFEEVKNLSVKTPVRVGFTAVEWGGVIEPSSYAK